VEGERVPAVFPHTENILKAVQATRIVLGLEHLFSVHVHDRTQYGRDLLGVPHGGWIILLGLSTATRVEMVGIPHGQRIRESIT